MAKRRRIVPDASVMLPAFFREKLRYHDTEFDLTNRAKPLADAITTYYVQAFAPDILLHEFMKRAKDKGESRNGPPVLDMIPVSESTKRFMTLPITYIPAKVLMNRAWILMTEHRLSASDSWYLSCAIQTDAELWLSHDQSDRVARIANQLHRNKVFLLTETRF